MAVKSGKKYMYNKQTVGERSSYTVTTGPGQGRYFSTCQDAQAYCDKLNAVGDVAQEEAVALEESIEAHADIPEVMDMPEEGRQLSLFDL